MALLDRILRRSPEARKTALARGAAAEALAARHLAANGLVVLERNYRVRGGEIDLICRDGNGIVFVEVRLRSRSDYGSAAASITPMKQRRIALAAQHWLTIHGACACRFDCLLLDRMDASAIVWIKDAFDIA